MAEQNPELADALLPNHSRQYYNTKVGFYSALVATAYGLPIDKTTRLRWTELTMLARAGDTFLDEGVAAPQQDERTAVFFDHLDNGLFSDTYTTLSPAALGEEMYDKMINSIRSTVAISINAKTETDIGRHFRLRLVEGARMADIALLLASDETKASPRFPVFARHFRSAGAWATVGNTSVDFGSDTRKGEVAVPYSRRNHLELIKMQAAWGLYFARQALKGVFRSRG